jgi:hypothetical protein
MMTIGEWRRRETDAVDEFVESVRTADAVRLAGSIEMLEAAGGWCRAMRRVARLPPPPKTFRRRMLDVWVTCGDALRDNVGDDLALADALRVLLPPYKGPPLRVYRGDSFYNRRRRTYGLSWSLDPDVADHFARGLWRTCTGGSVVLETDAPREAVICAPAPLANRYCEDEIIIDRRRLIKVRVFQRYSQISVYKSSA